MGPDGLIEKTQTLELSIHPLSVCQFVSLLMYGLSLSDCGLRARPYIAMSVEPVLLSYKRGV